MNRSASLMIAIIIGCLPLGTFLNQNPIDPTHLAPPAELSRPSVRDPLFSPPQPHSLSPPFSTNLKISDDTSDGEQNEVSIAMDTEGRLVAVWNDARDGNDYRCGGAYSHDGGLTWSGNFIYGDPDYDAAADPVVASDDAGYIYFVCMPFDRGPFGTSEIHVMRTSDGGVTWSTPVDIGFSTGFNDKPWIAAYGDGILYVGWTHYIFGGSRMVLRRSLDHGDTWSDPIYLNETNVDAGVIGMDVTENGTLYVAFWQDGYIDFRASYDMAETFTPRVHIFSSGGDCYNCVPRSSNVPVLAASPNGTSVYVVWSGFMGNASGEDINFARSHDGGATWEVIKLNDDNTSERQFMPFVDVDHEGRVHVMWSDLRSGNHEVYYTNSTDGGITFIPNIPVTDVSAPTIGFQGDYQAVLADDLGYTHVLWCDTRNGNGDIYYARAKTGNSSLHSIQVEPSFALITADDTQQFTATGYDRAGNPMPISPSWNVTGGSIDPTGLYTPDKVGNFTVYANDSGVSGTAYVEVLPGSLVSIEVTPSYAAITADDQQQFNATGYDANGNEVPITPTWETTGGSIDSSGLYTPGPVGNFTVYANQSGVSGSATVNVTHGVLAFIEVSPSFAVITADEVQQFNATGYDSKGNPVSISPTWWVSNGSIDAAGLFTPWAAMNVTVLANDSGVTGTAYVEVTPGVLSSIVVEPDGATITADDQLQFNATGYDSKGNEVPITPSWTAENGSITSDGLFTPWAVGTWNITAQVGAVEGTALVNVESGALATIIVSPAAVSITADDTQQFTASGFDSKGNPAPVSPTWETTGGSIDSTGLYTPDKVGTFDIYANQSGVSGHAYVTVTAGALATIIVKPSNPVITADDTQQFTAGGYDAKGNKVPISPIWEVTGGSINSTGFYTPGPAGNFTVYANQSGISGSTNITVTPGALVSIQVEPAFVRISSDEQVQFTAIGYDAKGNGFPVVATWWAESGSIDSTGLFTATSVGNWTVTATRLGVSGEARVEVLPGALVQIVVSPAFLDMTADDQAVFTAVGFDADGNVVPIAPTWEATGGSIDSTGLYVAGPVGSFTVYANESDVSGTALVNVTHGAVVSIEIAPAWVSTSADENVTFEAYGLDADGNRFAVSVAWSTLNGTISSDGTFTPWKVGNWTIKGELDGLQGVAHVLVTPGAVSRIVVTPETVELHPGETAEFVAVAYDAKGNAVPGVEVVWVTTGEVGTVDEEGHFVAESAGEGRVIALHGEVSGRAVVSVSEPPLADVAFLTLLTAATVAILFSTAFLTYVLVKRKDEEEE